VGEALAKIPEDSNFSVLEIGVGSGAILAALADERKSIQLTGTEISEEALEIANKNIQAYKDRLSLHLGDLFEPIDGQKFDMIVSNPPYISSSEFADLEPEVRLHDPKIALIAGEDGLDFYRRILNDVGNYLKDGGWLILELGDGQAESVVEIAREKGEFKDIAISKDLAGKERVFSSQFLGGGNG
jgi:release factor glutamine methyltransferase